MVTPTGGPTPPKGAGPASVPSQPRRPHQTRPGGTESAQAFEAAVAANRGEPSQRAQPDVPEAAKDAPVRYKVGGDPVSIVQWLDAVRQGSQEGDDWTPQQLPQTVLHLQPTSGSAHYLFGMALKCAP